MEQLFIEHWPWVVAYLAIGLIGMCGVQYIKGRGREGTVRELELDILSSAVVAFWPAVLVMGVSVVVLMGIAWPFIKLSEFCTNLGKKHRGTE